MQDISFCLGFQVLYLVVSPLFTLFCIKINEQYCNVSHLEAFSKCLVRLKNNHVSYIFCQVLPNVSSVFPSYFDSNLTHLKYNLKREGLMGVGEEDDLIAFDPDLEKDGVVL